MCKSSATKELSSKGNGSQKSHRKKTGTRRVRQLIEEHSSTEEEGEPEDDLLLTVDEVEEINRVSRPPIKVPVVVDGKHISMELDTGASVCYVRGVI